MLEDDWDKLDRKVVATIILSLSSNALFNVSTQIIEKGSQDHLSNMYEMPSASNNRYF